MSDLNVNFSKKVLASLLLVSLLTLGFLYYTVTLDKARTKSAKVLARASVKAQSIAIANATLKNEIEAKKKLAIKNSKINIIINAVPKSGSAYIAKSLENGLGYEHMPISNEYIPHDQVNFSAIREFYNGGSRISKQHLDPSKFNLQILRRFTDKMVLVLRDPREILLSWVHHVNSLKTEKVDLYYFDPEPPAEYYMLSLSEQIDWNIKYFLPEILNWINGWDDIKQQEDLKPNGIKILVLNYDELNNSEVDMYHKILQFYSIYKSEFKFAPPIKDRKIHFRKGEKDEWRSVYSDKQKQLINSLISDELLAKHGWLR